MMPDDIFNQAPYRCRLDWGRRGVRDAVERGDVLVIVDALSFSSAVATAAQHGVLVYPTAELADAAALAARVDAEMAVRRSEVPEKGTFSLSPLTFVDAAPGTRVVLPSPNGGACSRLAVDAPYVFAGAFLNAGAVADAAARIVDETDRAVTVIACGERWLAPHEDGLLRFAVEDYLAAGAILSFMPRELSPEARVCAGAFEHVKGSLLDVLRDCASGRDLRAKGYEDEIHFDARLNAFDAVPELRQERYAPFDREP